MKLVFSQKEMPENEFLNQLQGVSDSIVTQFEEFFLRIEGLKYQIIGYGMN